MLFILWIFNSDALRARECLRRERSHRTNTRYHIYSGDSYSGQKKKEEEKTRARKNEWEENAKYEEREETNGRERDKKNERIHREICERDM